MIRVGCAFVVLAAGSAWAQAPIVTNVTMVGSGTTNWPSVTTNLSVCQNICNFFFDQSVTGIVTREGGVYFEDDSWLTGFRAQTATFAANKQMSFSNLLLTAREQTNFYLQAVAGMVTNANGTWDGTFTLPSMVTNRLRFGVHGVYWTNTSDPTAVFTNGANYLAQSAGAPDAGVGFMRDGTYALTNFPSSLSRKVFSMDASNAVVRWDIGTGKTLTFNSQAGDPSGRSVLSWNAGKTNQLEISSGILDIRLGMVVAEFGYGRLLVSGTNAGYRQGLGSGDSLFLGLSPGSQGELMLSNAAPSYVRNAVVGSLGSGRLVVDNSLLTVSNLITIGEKAGHPGSELLMTNSGKLVAAGLGEITVGNATGVTGATLRVNGAGSRF